MVLRSISDQAEGMLPAPAAAPNLGVGAGMAAAPAGAPNLGGVAGMPAAPVAAPNVGGVAAMSAAAAPNIGGVAGMLAALVAAPNLGGIAGMAAAPAAAPAHGPDIKEPDTSIDAVLVSLPVSKQSQPPKVPPKLNVSHGDTLVKEKGREHDLQDKAYLPSNLEANLRLVEGLEKIDPELVRLRVAYLQSREGFQHQRRYKVLSSEYIRNAEVFIKKRGESSLSKILSTETDLEFLQQLLDDIYSLDTERMTMSPLTNSAPTGDPMLEALTAGPSCHRRENAALLAPVFDDIS